MNRRDYETTIDVLTDFAVWRPEDQPRRGKKREAFDRLGRLGFVEFEEDGTAILTPAGARELAAVLEAAEAEGDEEDDAPESSDDDERSWRRHRQGEE